ncbi:hypothetical protein [Escherichia phage vB_EcoM_IntR]|nr:hypothetical protein [Escherichia phage vB_EcoM_IntR]
MAQAKANQETLRRTIKARLERDMIINRGKEGTLTVEFSMHGVPGKLKVEQKVNRSLDQKLVPDVMKKLPKTVVAKLFKTKYEMSVTAYRNLTPEQLAIVDPVVKTSPGIPTVTFTPAATEEAE